MEIGVAILESNAADVLVGMDFLRIFKRVLFIHTGAQSVSLWDQPSFDAAAATHEASMAQLEPNVQPEIEPVTPETSE